MDSIIDQLGTQEIPRLRIGIGPVPNRQDPKDFVLGNFPKAQLNELRDSVFPKVLSHLASISSLGFELAMNACNAPEKAEEGH